ncbi:sulfatase-like hydrolase/transferase [Paenibacillus filicis]|uniref:Sulfatase-like hydrolase/transferase n=1 Tax=Paenibacillus gyeongsangnamensis TaxID=3388067 RepID=A0ABT4Q4A9_9BACL|nr:sulfatase/phosphatase domain-containing protein [Paenibacillus filicis]MCZ8511715.1 sulfatase-like hydrolase/transferase [Paenibacillus filicis]
MEKQAGPNIVLVILDGGSMDDWDDSLGSLEGIRFTQCYAQSEELTPSFCSFMTGWYPHVRGHRTPEYRLAPTEPFLLKQLTERGFATWWGGDNPVVDAEAESRVCTVRFRPEQTEAYAEVLVDGAVKFVEQAQNKPICICLTLRDEVELRTVIGRLTDAWKAAGEWDNTALFLFSARGRRSAAARVDGFTAAHVPLLIKYPSSCTAIPEEGQQVGALVELIDVYATIAELAGLPQRHTHFGRSLLPIIQGKAERHREQVFCEGGCLVTEPHAGGKLARGKSVMLRTAEWKFIKRLNEQTELYDLSIDPKELVNLADDPQYESVRKKLLNLLAIRYMETIDVVPYEPVMHKLEGRL